MGTNPDADDGRTGTFSPTLEAKEGLAFSNKIVLRLLFFDFKVRFEENFLFLISTPFHGAIFV